MPKFEKVNDHTIKIIVEQEQAVPLFQIVENKKKLLTQKKQIESALNNIDEILKNAEKLGITAVPTQPPKPKEKK